MLKKLYIRNFALIEETEIELDGAFNVLTGETGAGKSLLLGAISLILGKRADYSYIFNPEKKCIVEAFFGNLGPQVKENLSQFEEFDLEDEQLIIRREVHASGRSRAFINDTPVSLNVLKEAASRLVDLHGQHENQLLLSPDQQLHLLDQFAGSTQKVNEFRQLLNQFRSIQSEIDALAEKEKAARQQQDYYRFQLEELENANLNINEEEQVEEQISLMQNAEEIKEVLSYASEGLYNDENSLYNQLSEFISRLSKVENLNTTIREQNSKLEEARYSLQDAAQELEALNEGIDHDTQLLEELAERQDLYNRLKMKFSVASVEELIQARDDFAEKISQFDSLGTDIHLLQRKQNKAKADLVKLGKKIEKDRTKVLKPLATQVNALLKDVGFENSEFQVKMSRQPDADSAFDLEKEEYFKAWNTGFNQVSFLVRTNKGTPFSPLSQSASGGEISRIMLAIKAALAEKAELSVLIFDEIDTGISGETARKVGKVMQRLADLYQIIAITHLPQIAGKGSRHFQIYKEVNQDLTVSRVRALSQEERVLELAKMLSGASPSESAINNARELITDR